MQVTSTGLTDVGLRRSHNEDSFLVSNEMGLYLVADGMGGHAAGEVASSRTISVVCEFVSRARQDDEIAWPLEIDPNLDTTQNIIVTAVRLANQCLCALSETEDLYAGMGTTIAGVMIDGDSAHIVHVGDSRVYLLRDGTFQALTSDHSWVNEQLQRNILTAEEARTHRWRNVITRALGHKQEIDIDLHKHDVQPGDTWMLCSDGLTSMVEDPEIEQALANGDSGLDQKCRRLVDMANAEGGKDNITVLLIHIED